VAGDVALLKQQHRLLGGIARFPVAR